MYFPVERSSEQTSPKWTREQNKFLFSSFVIFFCFNHWYFFSTHVKFHSNVSTVFARLKLRSKRTKLNQVKTFEWKKIRKIHWKMDKSMTATAKSTPFSINDILTKNNTSIFRRCISSGNLSPISQNSIVDQTNENCDETTIEIGRNYVREFVDQRRFSSDSLHQDVESEMNDNECRRQTKEYRTDLNVERRSSLDCYLVDRNHNFSADISNKHRDDYHRRLRRSFYEFPVIAAGNPLDMRRCHNDSGEPVKTYLPWQPNKWLAQMHSVWKVCYDTRQA